MWTLNNIQIYPNGIDEAGNQIISELNPLGGGSIYHIFGYEEEKVTVTGIVIGESDKDSLITLRTTGLSYTLSGDLGVEGDFYVKTIRFKRRLVDRQTVRTDLPVRSPVYEFNMELLEDV